MSDCPLLEPKCSQCGEELSGEEYEMSLVLQADKLPPHCFGCVAEAIRERDLLREAHRDK